MGFNSLSQGIDITQNPYLTELIVAFSSINELDVSNNPNLVDLITNQSPNLTCIQVADEAMANNNEGIYENWTKDAWTVYSEDCSTASINDIENTSINIYPNPVRNFFTIKTDNNLELAEIVIYNFSGKKILSTTKKNTNISHLKNDIYFVKITTQKNKLILKKIIKIGN